MAGELPRGLRAGRGQRPGLVEQRRHRLAVGQPDHRARRAAPGAQRRAFEIGFLSRVHQRLCSPFGGNHQARKTCLQL
ncbi:LasR-specific antiactivator QslA [Pseudomonas benzenivorans]